MSIPATNTEEAALVFCEDVLQTYLPDRLTEMNTAYGLSLQPPGQYERELLFPKALKSTWVALKPTSETPTLVHDRQKVIIEVTVKVILHGPSSGLRTARDISQGLSVYTESVLFVLQRHVRGGRDGVYHCERNRRQPARQMVKNAAGGSPNGAFAGSRECGIRIHQQQPIV